MNIDKVYVCDIYRLKDISYNNFDSKSCFNHNCDLTDFVKVKYKAIYIKKALVRYSLLQGGFVDMETGQVYRLGYPSYKGDLFIDINKSKIYGRQLMGSKKRNYSMKKILKRYNEYKSGDNNECV